MSFQAIPTKTDGTASYQISVQLDGVYYLLQLDWNDRSSLWYMTLYDATQNLIVGSLPLLVRTPVLRGSTTSLSRPPGDFFVYDTTGKDKEAGFQELGSRCVLFYVTEEDNPSL